MLSIPDVSNLQLVIAFVLPGFIASHVRAQFLHGRWPRPGEAVLIYITLSALYLAAVAPLLGLMPADASGSLAAAAVWLTLVFVGPAILGTMRASAPQGMPPSPPRKAPEPQAASEPAAGPQDACRTAAALTSCSLANLGRLRSSLRAGAPGSSRTSAPAMSQGSHRAPPRYPGVGVRRRAGKERPRHRPRHRGHQGSSASPSPSSRFMKTPNCASRS
jgi:hypothetical protein